ncbi:MAG: type II toxin-antitoxin system mRNA interferase toxin, RelE/StbE family [Plectolyngbya sp. WJT66-NPBG17]|jgi:mRNA interferase RelE/StbE|nr:type II toxin-antitoxin system mRNA interferase toxin, RelE/StbE family [Plectolyngbya sp. WJT66-NPBG17]MBW4526446.1 type II toxin-antitoxin system mRNA interferase toxin, RelE/StbE family [Phormidium tanganyikae FI6-MK23]
MTDESNLEYGIQFTSSALEMLGAIKDRRELEVLKNRINKLKSEPEKQGKALVDNLVGYRSVRAVGQRYRIIYRVEETTIVVLVVGVGKRKEGDKKDIYALLKRLLDD